MQISDRAIHVWTVRTDASVALPAGIFSADETARASRYLSDQVRRSFMVARAALRTLLGRYQGVRPADIQFTYGAKGKPELAGIEFNASHSGSLAVFAFTRECAVGIDVERIRGIDSAQFPLCPEEASELAMLPPGQREQAFFLCWTRKEAYMKAIGAGFSVGLNTFRVTLQPGEPARIVHLSGDTDAAKEWTLHNLDLSPDYAAALAYRDAERPVLVMPVTDPGELLTG